MKRCGPKKRKSTGAAVDHSHEASDRVGYEWLSELTGCSRSGEVRALHPLCHWSCRGGRLLPHVNLVGKDCQFALDDGVRAGWVMPELIVAVCCKSPSNSATVVLHLDDQ